MNEISLGAFLQGGKYRIEKVLGQGGFGITYLAEQTNLNRKVCIKEFFMKEYGERTTSALATGDATTVIVDEATVLTSVSAVTSAAAEIMGKYRDKFIKEAKTIAKFDHPGIVRIHDVFEENGTAYYVMDFIEGGNLNDMVKREGPLSEDRALGYIRQIADALAYVHGHNIMHLDVKPANVIVRKSDDRAILIDFGMAKQYDASGTQTSTTPVGLSVGYAPIEMTKPGGVQTFSPETDVYSLGATLYYLVTGQNPPDASERMEMIMEGERFKLPNSVSGSTAELIEQSMQSRKKRIQNVKGFLELLHSGGKKKPLEPEKKAEAKRDAEEPDVSFDVVGVDCSDQNNLVTFSPRIVMKGIDSLNVYFCFGPVGSDNFIKGKNGHVRITRKANAKFSSCTKTYSLSSPDIFIDKQSYDDRVRFALQIVLSAHSGEAPMPDDIIRVYRFSILHHSSFWGPDTWEQIWLSGQIQ